VKPKATLPGSSRSEPEADSALCHRGLRGNR